MSDFWDSRFGTAEYIYGTEPNAYFKQFIDTVKPGIILVPGAGEGRDAVYAATKGWEVIAFDLSIKGKEKAHQLAMKNNVSINYSIADAAEYASPKMFDAIGMIYFHLPPQLRKEFHQKMIDCLKPGGTLLIEVFNPAQLTTNTYGPKDVSMLYTSAMLAEDFAELDILENTELETVLDEGAGHKGKSSIIRFKAVKKN